MYGAWAEVNLEQLRKNIQFLKKCKAQNADFMGIVKANAYGHGAVEVAKILVEEGVHSFGVANVQEGKELRDAGFIEPILVLGHTFAENYELLTENGLTMTVSSSEEAMAISKFGISNGIKVPVHIKIDTGMGRLGVLADSHASEIVKNMTKLNGISIEGFFSHLATGAQVKDTSYAQMQFEKFSKLISELEKENINIPRKHISNSGATILFPHMHMDMVRIGTAMYGLYASDELEGLPGMENYPVMEIKARLANIKSVPAGTKVSYTGSFETKQDSVLGVVPLGYVDGIFRNLANVGEVIFRGKRCRMVGNICMDQFVIDITDIDNPIVGDEVVIVGKQGDEFISAEEIASTCQTISIEVLCGLGKRIPLVYV